MISNQVLQNTLEGLKEISRTEFCIIDTEGKVLATTFSDFSIQQGDIQAFVESQADSQLVKGFQYFKVCDDYQLEYILVAHGDDEDTYMIGKLAAFQIQNLIVAYKERFDKDSFIKNLLLDNPAPRRYLQPRQETAHRCRCTPCSYDSGTSAGEGSQFHGEREEFLRRQEQGLYYCC